MASPGAKASRSGTSSSAAPHWAVAALVLYDYWQDSGDRWHRNLGYAAAALVLLRLLWACVGSPPARFASWWPTPARLSGHCAGLRRADRAARSATTRSAR